MKKIISTENTPIKLWLDDIEAGTLVQAKNLANLSLLVSVDVTSPGSVWKYQSGPLCFGPRRPEDAVPDDKRIITIFPRHHAGRVIGDIPLDDKDRQRLAEHLSTLVGKKVTLKTEVDSRLIGGIIARIGGKLLDSSTRSKLTALKRELARRGR